MADNNKLLLFGALGIGGYFAYRWYAGPGGYADQQLCGSHMTAAQLQALAVDLEAAAAKQKLAPLDLIAAAVASASPTAENQLLGACQRVAVTQYPLAAPGTSAADKPADKPADATPNALDALYVQLKGRAAADSFFSGSGDSLSSTPDHWNVYLSQMVGQAVPAELTSSFGHAGASTADAQNALKAMIASSKTLQAGFAPGSAQYISTGDAIAGYQAQLAALQAAEQAANVTAAAYWATVAPWVKQVKGLAGLGFYGGLGAIAFRRTR